MQMTLLPGSTAAPAGANAFFRARSGRVPPWARVLQDQFPGVEEALNMSNRLVIFLPVDSRTFAICFGHGSSTLEWNAVEPNFGLRFAARAMQGLGKVPGCAV
jgi:uncharacterized protein (TIGR04141 family)